MFPQYQFFIGVFLAESYIEVNLVKKFIFSLEYVQLNLKFLANILQYRGLFTTFWSLISLSFFEDKCICQVHKNPLQRKNMYIKLEGVYYPFPFFLSFFLFHDSAFCLASFFFFFLFPFKFSYTSGINGLGWSY